MALTDIVKVTLLVMGGLLVTGITLSHIGGGSVAGGFTGAVFGLHAASAPL